VIPVLVKIAKGPAVPRRTGVCPVNSTALVVVVLGHFHLVGSDVQAQLEAAGMTVRRI